MTEIERWLPVIGAEGSYEISDRGGIRSVERTVIRTDGRMRPFPGVALSPGVMPTGHLTVALSVAGKRRTDQVHRLVAAAFIGPRPDGMEVRHLDGNPSNNDVRNLAYGTRSQNCLDRVAHGVHNNAKKTHCRHGHTFSPDNTYHRPQGGRRCRICKSVSEQKRRQAKRRAGAV